MPIRYFAVLPLVMSAAAVAKEEQPYKLVILREPAGIAITDYPSRQRCEEARKAIEDLVAARNEERQARTYPRGRTLIPVELKLEAYCIPG